MKQNNDNEKNIAFCGNQSEKLPYDKQYHHRKLTWIACFGLNLM